jgi:hypothetical protein
MQQGWKVAAGAIVLCGSLFGMNLAEAQNTTAPAATKATVKETAVKETAVKEVGTKATEKEAAPTKKAAKKPAGRLPVFYAEIVTEEQRAKIYVIQGSYADKLKALAAQIKAVQAEQNAEIEAVLTEEQKAKLQAAKDEAAAKRKQKTEAAEAKAEVPKKVAAE